MPLFRLPRRTTALSGRRMAVKPDVPWYWRSLSALGGVALASAIAWGVFNATVHRDSAAASEVDRLQKRLDAQEEELAQVRPRLAQAERQTQIDRAAAADLAKQVKSLAHENAALKEDLAFFQSLMATPVAREGTLSVNRFRVQPNVVAGEYRYQMLLVQAGQRLRDFQGSLQFVLDVQQDGRKVVLTLPPEPDRASGEYRLNFKFFQRVEGTFKLAPGSELKGMQVRVFENGVRAPKLTQTLDVS
jgi:septal ring factor EnvC (AmiA/AmiB activator)